MPGLPGGGGRRTDAGGGGQVRELPSLGWQPLSPAYVRLSRWPTCSHCCGCLDTCTCSMYRTLHVQHFSDFDLDLGLPSR